MIREWIIKKLQPKNPNQGVLTNEMREKALETRRLQHDLKQTEARVEMQKRMQILEQSVNPKASLEEKMFTMFAPILISKLAGQMGNNTKSTDYGGGNDFINSQSQTAPQTAPQTEEINFSDNEIANMINANPDLVRKSKLANDIQIKEHLLQQMPMLGKKTIDKIIVQVRDK